MLPFNKILPETLHSLGIKKQFNSHMIIYNWRDIVGNKIADNSRPVKIENGVMLLLVTNSVWCHHLSIMKSDIIKQVNEYAGQRFINDIRFQTGCLTEIHNEEEENNQEEPQLTANLYAVRLDETEASQAKHLVDELTDSYLKHNILRIIYKHQAFNKVKLKHNWHQCSSCTVLCPPEQEYCTICSIEKREADRLAVKSLLREIPWLTYYEIKNYINCSVSEFLNAKNDLILLLANDIKENNDDKVDILTLVMLITGKKPELLTDNIIDITLAKVRRKNYVSSPRR